MHSHCNAKLWRGCCENLECRNQPKITKHICFRLKNMQIEIIKNNNINEPATWHFQQCSICDQQSLRSACAYAQSDQSLYSSLEYSMTVKLLTEHYLEFLSLKGGCTGLYESTLVKMSHCWKSHVTHFNSRLGIAIVHDRQICTVIIVWVHLSIQGSLTLAMGKCLWFSVKIKVCQSSHSSPWSYPDLSTLWLWNPFSI